MTGENPYPQHEEPASPAGYDLSRYYVAGSGEGQRRELDFSNADEPMAPPMGIEPPSVAAPEEEVQPDVDHQDEREHFGYTSEPAHPFSDPDAWRGKRVSGPGSTTRHLGGSDPK